VAAPQKDVALTPKRESSDTDLLGLYLADINRYPLLTRDEERRLAQQIEEGTAAREALDSGAAHTAVEARKLRKLVQSGDDARRRFVQSNLRLVVSIARKYESSQVPLLDLIQEGNLGVMHAVEKFDWRKGFKFSTYATWWIRRAITDGLESNKRAIRLPSHAHDIVTRVQRVRFPLEVRLGRPATVAELASEVELPVAKVAEVLRVEAHPASLSEPLTESGGALEDIIADMHVDSPLEESMTAAMAAALEKLLLSLDERERKVISLRFGLDRGTPRTLGEVASHFGLTRERIRQIEVRAMARLRAAGEDTEARALLNA
jgi:RNA polymerase sigma factor (sigma-70 family)